MKNNSGRIRTLLLMVFAALFVVAAISAMAFFSAKKGSRNGIVLPGAGHTSTMPEVYEQNNDGFISVNKYNVSQVIRSLSRPECYKQTLSRLTVDEGVMTAAAVQFTVKGDVHKLSILEETQYRHFLMREDEIYLWYNDDAETVTKASVYGDVRPDNLAGVVTYETIAEYPASQILEIDYVQYPAVDGDPCLYVRVQEDNDTEILFWVNMNTGLLCKAEEIKNGVSISKLQEQSVTVLSSTDVEVEEELLLPNGKNPFASQGE